MANNEMFLKLIGEIDEKRTTAEVMNSIKKIESALSGKDAGKIDIGISVNKNGDQFLKYSKTAQDSYGNLITQVDKFKVSNDGMASSLGESTRYLKDTTRAASSFSAEMGAVIRRTLESAATLGLMYGALSQLRQGIQYITDLDKEMTNIQLVTGGSEEQINGLAQGYNVLAKEMGATTLEVAKGSLEFVRQGKTAEETAILIKNSTMMSKLGNMDSATATDRLTSIMNGFKLEAEETGAVLDKLIALDNSYATSVNEIATAMKYSSNSAQSVGIDLDHLAAYITVISSTTRVSAETIGQSLKTMTARFSDIKQGFDVGEGLDVNINNIEEALRDVNIPLRDDANNFRDMQDVLEDLGKVWDTLGDVQQKQIVKQFAGIRQREQFLVLMENQVEVEKAIRIEQESLNLATERYAIFLDSVEASHNKMTASWEKLAMSSITSDMISGFYESASAILDFIDTIGGIPTVLKIVIPLLILFNLELIKTKALSTWGSIASMSSSLVNFGKSLSVAIKLTRLGVTTTTALNVAFGATAVTAGALALALMSTVAVLYTYNEQVVKTQKEGEKINASVWDKIFTDISSKGATSVEILDKYKQGIDAINKSHEEAGLVADVFVDKQKLIDEGLISTIEQLGLTSQSYDEYIKKVKEAATLAGYKIDEKGQFYKGEGRGRQYSDDFELKESTSWGMGGLSPDDRDELNQVGKTSAEVVYNSFNKTLSELASTSETLSSLIGKSMKGELDFSDIASIPPEYLSSLTVQEDKLKLNLDLIKETQIEEARLYLESIKLSHEKSDATSQDVAVAQLYYDQLLKSSENTFGQFNQTAWQYDELLWKISNDAIEAGYSATDMEGNVLDSASSIHDYLAGSTENFNAFVEQLAGATGRKTSEVMSIIQSMTYDIYADTLRMINELGNAMGAYAARYTGLAGLYGKTPTYGNTAFTPSNPTPPLFPNPGGYSGGKGSGGGGSAASDKAQKQAEKLKEIEKQIAEARDSALDNLKNQLKIYKQMVDQRKELLDTMKEERSYQQDLEEKQGSVVNIQNQISELSLDDSAEARAQVLALQEQLAEAQQELGNLEYEHGIEQQKSALDTELSRVESLVESAIMAIEGIDASSLSSFTNQLSVILAGLGSAVPTFHTGGIVGGRYESRENEQFAKLLNKELVVTPEQMSGFMNKTLPSIMSGSPSVSSTLSGMEIGQLMNFNISGNLDRDTLPSIEKIAQRVVEKLNDNMLIRGTKRGAGLFSA